MNTVNNFAAPHERTDCPQSSLSLHGDYCYPQGTRSDWKSQLAMALNRPKKHHHAAWMLLMALLCSLAAQAQDTFTSPDGTRYRVEPFLTANFPVGLAFTPDGELFYNEKTTGNVRYVRADGTRQIEPVISLAVDALQERGLQAIALDPHYETNRHIWVFYTAQGTSRDYPANKVLRFQFEDGIGTNPVEFLSLPIDTGHLLHNGGGLQFDDEGYLYVGVGDYGDASRPQDLTLPHGKIHRFAIQDDRLVIPDDNPFEGSSIYAYGLRNPFDYAFDPLSGRLFATENGDDCDDELNLILPGFNYGYREHYECAGTRFIVGLGRYLPPLLSYTPTIAPAGIAFYDHPALPQWRNDLFFCSWNDGVLHHVRLAAGRNRVEFDRQIELGAVRCRIDVAVSPSGAIYFGTVGGGTGAIYRLLPLHD